MSPAWSSPPDARAAMPVPHAWHPGELAAQAARGFEDDVWGAYEGYQEGAPDWMALFLSQLPFLSLTTLDGQGRPWTSLVFNDGRAGFVQPTERENVVRLTIRAGQHVPIRACLIRLRGLLQRGESPFDGKDTARLEFSVGGVGVMMHNRRRNKLEGVVVGVDRVSESDEEDVCVFDLLVLNTFGNCPKYINGRFLAPVKDTATAAQIAISGDAKDGDLPSEVVKHIHTTDLVFLATKYSGNDPSSYTPDPPRLGNNHRGGPPGFLRTYWDEERRRRCVVLPDWSGNRMMMSFGNMTKDPVAGLTIPIWSSDAQSAGSLVHMTCSAQVLAGEEAQRTMRGVRGAVRLWIESWSYTRNNMPLFVAPVEFGGSSAGIGWSPYNPPVRKLTIEQTQLAADGAAQSYGAVKMIDANFWTDELATFVFVVEGGDEDGLAHIYKHGQHVVVDCYDLLDTRIQMYSHMARFRGGEKDLNDDGTRSWTVTHTGVYGDAGWRFELTLRRKQRGGVTPTLFGMGQRVREALEQGLEPPRAGMKMDLLGVDGSAVLPTGRSGLRLVYLLSGIGLTPLLPHLAQLTASGSQTSADVMAIIATRADEAGVVQRIVHHALTRSKEHGGVIRLTVYLLISAPEDVQAQKDIDDALWQDLPPNVTATVQCSRGKRLTSQSLSCQSIGQEPDGVFLLPQEHAAAIDAADMFVICAGSAFAQTARQALVQANVADAKVHMESFAF